jgi:hypothetical protein
MANDQQETLTGPVPGLRRRVWCRGVGCHHQLYTAESRRRRYGPICDPDYRTPDPDHDVDQDPIPGL